MLPVLLFLAAQEIEPPKTVNDQILGTVEEYMTRGPARVCISYTSIDIGEDETAYVDYLGIHRGIIRVRSSRGTYTVTEGDSWADPGSDADYLTDWRDRTIVRNRRGRSRSYLIFGPTDSPWEEVPQVMVAGDALGKSRDTAILNAITINRREPKDCDRRFDYGWNFLMGE